MTNKPYCSKCNANVNVVDVENTNYFRCYFCGKIIRELTGQTTLREFIKL